MKIPLNATVDVLEEINNDWAKILYNNTIGYMMREFLLVKPQDNPIPDSIIVQLQLLREKLIAAIALIDTMLTT